MTTIRDVTIDIVTDEEHIQTIGGGGLKVQLGGERLNRHVNEEQYDWYEWHPEYAGVDVVTDLWNLIMTTTTVLDERARYDDHWVGFVEFPSGVILEYLGEDVVRVAFRVAEDPHSTREPRVAVPESACGYPVDAAAWGEAVLEAGQALRDELVELGHEDPGDEDGFDPVLADLRRQLEAA